MNVLVACEFSGRVRDAFIKRGHNAVSCDILPSESKIGPHIQGDAIKTIKALKTWANLLICHPPCTHLSNACAGLWKEKFKDGRQIAAILFFMEMYNSGFPRICVENPAGIINSKILKPSQHIEPFQFGHPTRKHTCLWLKNLPLLKPTNLVTPIIAKSYIRKKGPRAGRIHNCYFMDIMGGKNRAHLRSITFQGIADAMADQWGSL
jgi:hypothetical protein